MSRATIQVLAGCYGVTAFGMRAETLTPIENPSSGPREAEQRGRRGRGDRAGRWEGQAGSRLEVTVELGSVWSRTSVTSLGPNNTVIRTVNPNLIWSSIPNPTPPKQDHF